MVNYGANDLPSSNLGRTLVVYKVVNDREPMNDGKIMFDNRKSLMVNAMIVTL